MELEFLLIIFLITKNLREIFSATFVQKIGRKSVLCSLGKKIPSSAEISEDPSARDVLKIRLGI